MRRVNLRLPGGSASIVNILDVFSHLMIDSLPCLHTTHANTQDYQLLLRRAFVAYGLPEQISFDHDSVFYDNQTASPFPTVLHLWLVALGIGVRFMHKTPPLEHARIERHHQTFTDEDDLQKALTGRILFLNTDYPSRSLRGQAPLSACRQPNSHHALTASNGNGSVWTCNGFMMISPRDGGSA
jgi:hypothetical protein